MADPVFIIYPETYKVLNEQLNDGRFEDDDELDRVTAIVSCWGAALQTHGDQLEKVVMYNEQGKITYVAYPESGWNGQISLDEED